MIVTLIYKEKLNTITLPNKKEGQFWLGTDEEKEIISIEGSNEKWELKSSKKVKILEHKEKTIELKENTIIKIQKGETIGLIFTEPLTEDRQIYTKKVIEKDIGISIGRSEENAICFKNDFVSSVHAKLAYHNKYWLIKDNNSTNGIFVNGKKEKAKDLDFGDVIYIMGLKIIVFYDFIMINNPDGKVTIKEGVFQETPEDKFNPFDNNEEDEEIEEIEEMQREYFYRSPRFKRDIEEAKFKIDNPPERETGEKMPAALTIGPSVTMGLASMTTTGFTISNAITSGNIQSYMPSIVMSGSMLLGTLLWPMVTKVYEKGARKKQEKYRQEKYIKYLGDVEQEIEKEQEKQRQILKENFVTIDECEDRILKTKRTLWEREIGQNDFLKLRIGIGNKPLDAEISYPEKRFSLKEDNLQDKMYEFCEKPKILENVPITVSLYDDYISGVIGDCKKVKEFAKGLIFQLAALYSYDEVKMIFLYNEKDKDEFEFVKWLPHTFTNDKSFRFIATNADEAKEISYYLDGEITTRIQANNKKKENMLPYYIIFALDKELALKSEIINQIYNEKENLNISVINFVEELQELPKECTTVIEIQEEAKMYERNDITGNNLTFKPDIYLTADPKKLSIKLANTLLDTLENGYELPTLISFLQMFQVGKIEHLNILNRWKNNDPTKSLATPIGVDTYGELFKLDLHEKFHGPHGLVAGMTGSGKSEFIMTYILSLAVNYHPDEVAFILIDYKGGGMAKSFEKLPHVAGIITNLDGASINRAIVSINSELKRRQRIFDQTSKKTGTSNIDIYKYQKLYREHEVDEPLPHLFIISDEFAELKSQRPEFMSELVSAARIGRSLGVHLILATQKPNVVVDDQIWSNSKFRICLKVQEKADSMDMLKRPDAAMLKETGRFYLQVGYNELFELGQSAWAGAPYYPVDKYVEERDNSVSIIDNNARVLKQVKLNKNKGNIITPKKQLDAITMHISSIAEEEHISVKPIWLPPISENILLNEIEEKYNIFDSQYDIKPVIGEYDDPVNQSQSYLRIPITQQGNLLVYGSQGSGKLMLITTMIYSIINKHTPKEVNLYLLDFEAGTLNAFAKAPHIGDVMLAYDAEKITNLFKTLYKELETRKRKFAEYGGSYLTYIEESEEKVPNIIIVINNYAAFAETYPEKEDAINYLTREGSKYGIYFVATLNSTNAMKYRTSQNFGQSLVLQFNDESNYTMVLGKTGGLVPSHYEGRGLVKINKNIYEFQTAKIVPESTPYKFIREQCKELTDKYSGFEANKIAVLPRKITPEILKPYVKNNLNIPIGMEKNTLQIHYLNAEKHYINMILSEDKSYLQFLQDISNFISNEYTDVETTLVDEADEVQVTNSKIRHVVGTKSAEEFIDEIYQLVLERNNKYKDALSAGTQCETFQKKLFIINSIRTLLENKDNVRVEKLELALEKGSKNYNVNFIIFDELKKISILTAKKWYKNHINPDDGMWIGKGFSNQYNFRISNNTGEIKKDITDKNFAISINNGEAKIVKILNTKEDESNE